MTALKSFPTDLNHSVFQAQAAVIFYKIWGQLPKIPADDLQRLRCQTVEEVLNQNLKVKWIHSELFDLCSLRISGPRGDGELYRISDIKRLVPRTFIVPWSQQKQDFDQSQAITGLIKIAGMQDEGTQQILDLEYINHHCQGGYKVSVEKANGKACSIWLKQLNGKEYLGFSSKNYADPRFIYPLPQLLSSTHSMLKWVTGHFEVLLQAKRSDDLDPLSLIQAIAYYSFKRLKEMTHEDLIEFFDYLRSGITLCGELEEGGKHVIPTARRVVYFVGSTFKPNGIEISSPLACRQQLAQFGFQTLDELYSSSEAFTQLIAQASALQLGDTLREGSVDYFLSPQGQVVASIKVKDPHYMFYRKLRNAMCSSAQSSQDILHRLMKSIRDPYYLSCLKTAGISADFNSKMLRGAACFLAWFSDQKDLGQNFDLAGFQAKEIGLGALLARWKQANNEPAFGEYPHLKTQTRLYTFPQTWCEQTRHTLSVAMLSFHGAQGSGKTTLSRLLAQRFNQHSLTFKVADRFCPLALALEQDPLQKKKTYVSWLENSIYPEIKAWLNAHTQSEHHTYPTFSVHDKLPLEIVSALAWSKLGDGRTGRKFIRLLDHVTHCFTVMINWSTLQSKTRPTESTTESIKAAKLLIINARCNQNHQATQAWAQWLEQQHISGHASLRLNAPIEILEKRIQHRKRENDEELLGDIVASTHREVQDIVYVDQDLDATQSLESLLEASLKIAHLALERVDERWFLNI